MANAVYHWKHGWIPLDFEAAMEKAGGDHAKALAMLDDAQGDNGIKSIGDLARAARALLDLNSRHHFDALTQIHDAADRLDAHDVLPTPLRRKTDYAARTQAMLDAWSIQARFDQSVGTW